MPITTTAPAPTQPDKQAPGNVLTTVAQIRVAGQKSWNTEVANSVAQAAHGLQDQIYKHQEILTKPPAPVKTFSVFDNTGKMIGVIGDYTWAGIQYYGMWFQQFRLGGVDPSDAHIIGWPDGSVTIDGTVIAPGGGGGLLKSIFDYGVAGDGITDDSPGFILAVGDGGAWLPGGHTYLLNQAIAIGDGVSFIGDGPTSVVKRGAALLPGQGLFDITGSNIYFANFAIDGDVTVAVGVLYSTLAAAPSPYDPMQDILSLNTSIWVHGDAMTGTLSNLTFESMLIQHTGGYAMAFDARLGDICDVMVLNPHLVNNRPHLFGTTAGDLSYGSWTGGIHYQGDGGPAAPWSVKGLLIDGGTFRRNTGNCIWGHSYAYDTMHSNVRATGHYFEDCGLDCIQLAMTSGGAVSNNKGRRIGYIALDDTSAAVPKYLGARYAVFIDTSGCTSVNYSGNSAVSVLGGFYDLDGFAQGTIEGNSGRVPVVGESEYDDDNIASWPVPAPSYGIQLANNYYPDGGKDVTITGNTLINMMVGGIRLFSARGCNVSGNTIQHPAGATLAPVIIGNFTPASGSGTTYSQNNSITENNIQWAPATAKAAVQELEDWGAGPIPWLGTERNWIASNRLSGANMYEFSRAPSSVSTTGTMISSEASGLTAGSPVTIKRERASGADFTSMYGPTGSLQWRFLDTYGQLNVSKNGTGGSVTTGVRAGLLAVDDTVATAHLAADGFIVVTNTTFTDAHADVFTSNTTGLIRYNATTHIFEQSVAVSGGHRVWAAFGGAGVAPGLDTQVIFNDGGSALGASANLTFDKVASILTIVKTASNSGVIANLFNSTATGTMPAFQCATSGTAYGFTADGVGVFGVKLLINNVVYWWPSGLPTTGQSLVAADNAGTLIWAAGASGGAPGGAGANSQVIWNKNGVLFSNADFIYNETTKTLVLANGGPTQGVQAYTFGSFATGANVGFSINNGNATISGDGTFVTKTGYVLYDIPYVSTRSFSLSSQSGVFRINSSFATGGARDCLVVNGTSGNVGIGTASPAAKLHVSQADNTIALLFNGTTRGIRFNLGSFGSAIEGVDNTGSISYQPLALNGSQLLFQTNGTERMHIDTAGNVGIGTPLPASPLTIIAATNPATPATATQLAIGETTNNPGYRLSVGFYADTAWKGVIQATAGGAGNPLLLNPNGGSVGIGLAAPVVPLHVFGSVSNEVARFQSRNDASNNRSFFSLYTTNGNYWWEFSSEDTAGGGTSNGLALRENSAGVNSLRVYCASGGNVGIGTAAPGYLLDVNGTGRAVTSFISGLFNSTAPNSATAAFQTASGTMILYGNGNVACQNVTATSTIQTTSGSISSGGTLYALAALSISGFTSSAGQASFTGYINTQDKFVCKGSNGVTATFNTADANKMITVTGGIITSVV